MQPKNCSHDIKKELKIKKYIIGGKSNTISPLKYWLRILVICVLFCFTQHFYALFLYMPENINCLLCKSIILYKITYEFHFISNNWVEQYPYLFVAQDLSNKSSISLSKE